jgi:ubiquinone/menaquinone biosynthesis C-methylase UbiE
MLRHIFRDNPHTCPWWFAYTFDNPLRRLVHNPRRMLDGLVKTGDRVADIGCGLGYFTLGMARLVGPQGSVVAVDLQEEMLRRVRRRAHRAGLVDRIEFHQSTHERIGITGSLDFVLAFWMVHEVRNRRSFLTEIRSLLKPSGHLLIAEPKGHVSESLFGRIMERTREAGFDVRAGPGIRLSRSMLCSAQS